MKNKEQVSSDQSRNRGSLLRLRASIDGEQIINSIYFLFSLLAIPSIILTLYKTFLFGLEIPFIFDISLALLLVLIAVFRQKIKYKIKLYVAIISCYLFGFAGILFQGIENTRWISLLLVAIYALLLYNTRLSIISVLISLIGVFTIGWIHQNGFIEPIVHFILLDSNLLLVASYIFDLLLLLGLILYIIKHITDQLGTLIEQKDKEIKANILLHQNIIQKEIDFRNIFDGSKDMIVICDLDCNYITSNKAFQGTVDFNTSEFKNQKVNELLLPCCKDDFADHLKSNRSADSPPMEIELTTKNGIKSFEANSQLIEYDNALRAMTIFRDITERKNNKRIIEESNNRWKIAESTINMGLMDWNLDNGSIILSEQMKKILDIKNDRELTYEVFLEYIHPIDKNKYVDLINQRINTKSNSELHLTYDTPIEYRIIRKNGIKLYIKEFGVLYFEINKPQRYVSAHIDNTEAYKSVRKLNQQKRYFSELVDAIQNSFIVIRGVNMIDGVFKDFILLNANQVFLKTINKGIEDIFEKTLKTILPFLDQSFYINCSEAVKTGQPIIEEMYSQDLKKHFSITYQKIKYKSLFLILEDITDKKMMQNKIMSSIINAEEQERSRISKELHDGIGPLLSTLKLFTEKYCNTTKDDIKEKIEPQLYNIIDEAISNVSTISNNLTPHILENFGLNKAIKRFIKQLELVTSCTFDFKMNTTDRFDSKIEISIYRTLIEIINNSIKYSKPTKIILTINFTDNEFIIDFMDNGKGFDFHKQWKNKRGQGLINIKSRIESIGGNLDYMGDESTGVRYHIELPIEA